MINERSKTEIIEILDNIIYWDSCPIAYKEKIPSLIEELRQVKDIAYKPVLCGVISDDEIADHIRTNCRHSNGDKAMDEQAFYEGAKWMRGKLKP